MTIRIGLIHNFGHKTMKKMRFEKLLAIFMLVGTIVFNLWLYRLEPTAKIDPNDNTFQYALVDRTNQIWDFAQQSCASSKFKVQRSKLDLPVISSLTNFALCTFNFALLFDHWVPNWAQGYNLPYYYSHLPQIFIVGSYRLFSTLSKLLITSYQLPVTLFQYYHLIIYLLLSFFPLSAFWALRVIGLPWLTAGLGALLATQISTDGLYGLDPASFLWRGYGLSSQLFAMFFLPLAIAYSWRWLSVRGGLTFWPAVFFLFATTAGHLGIGIIAFLSIGILALAPSIYSILNQKSKDLTLKQFRSDLTKLMILAGVAIFFLSYWIIPIFLNGNYHNISVWDPIWKFDSYGAKDIVNKLFNGDLFDFGRFPVLTILVFLGLFTAASEKIFAARFPSSTPEGYGELKLASSGAKKFIHEPAPLYFAFVLLFLFWLLLYFGRTTWGGLIDFIPGISEFHLSRFIVGIHLAGLFLAPIGVQWLVEGVVSVFKRFAFPNWIVGLLDYLIIGLLLFSVYPQTIRYNQTNEVLIRRANDNYAKVAGDFHDLLVTLRKLEAERPGRILTGRGGSWGKNFRVAETPYYMALSTEGLPVVLWLPETWSPNSDTEQFLNEGLERDYALYNIRYVVTPARNASHSDAGGPPTPPAGGLQPFWKLVKATPSWKLYTVNTPGYFSLGTRPAIVSVTKENYLNLVHLWVQSDYPQKGFFPQLTFAKNYPKKTGLPNFRLLDEANYLVPDGSVHNLFAEPPIYQLPITNYQLPTILSQESDTDMIFKAKVEVPKDCVECLLVLKQTYHPNWKATVDGREVKPINVFPFFLAVPLSQAGTHEVIFSYQPSRLKVILLIIELGTLAIFLLISLRRNPR